MQNKPVFIVYSCDEWHTRTSFQVQGVFTKDKISVIKAMVKRYQLDNNALSELEESNQTQGREKNYMIEEVTANTLGY